ncbi:MAG: hypothetical protein MPJ78_09745 [Hyphomicrobiaceae bacterium]|nr:hypothetical protein [Hyphomicrobiaceae bacterium]
MSSTNKTESGEGETASMPETRSQWAWGLATLLLIVLAFTSHELTQAQRQLEKSESRPATAQEASGSVNGSHPDMTKIIETLKKVDSASNRKAVNLKRALGDVNNQLQHALQDVDRLGAEHRNVAALRGKLKAVQNKLEMAIAEVEMYEKPTLQ